MGTSPSTPELFRKPYNFERLMDTLRRIVESGTYPEYTNEHCFYIAIYMATTLDQKLAASVFYNQTKHVAYYLQQGADPNTVATPTALTALANSTFGHSPNPEITALLLHYGADPDKPCSHLFSPPVFPKNVPIDEVVKEIKKLVQDHQQSREQEVHKPEREYQRKLSLLLHTVTLLTEKYYAEARTALFEQLPVDPSKIRSQPSIAETVTPWLAVTFENDHSDMYEGAKEAAPDYANYPEIPSSHFQKWPMSDYAMAKNGTGEPGPAVLELG